MLFSSNLTVIRRPFNRGCVEANRVHENFIAETLTPIFRVIAKETAMDCARSQVAIRVSVYLVFLLSGNLVRP